MAVDAWAKSGGGAPAARRAEALLERMDRLYRDGGGRHEALKPTTGIFNAVINVSLMILRLVVACLFVVLTDVIVIGIGMGQVSREDCPSSRGTDSSLDGEAARAGR
jgi:hypothetical protein